MSELSDPKNRNLHGVHKTNSIQENNLMYQIIFLIMEIILEHNIFSFHESHRKPEMGAAIKSKPVPSYKNIFLASMDNEIKKDLLKRTTLKTVNLCN